MFEASASFDFFDYFRVPYRVVPRRDSTPARLQAGREAGLLWAPADTSRGHPLEARLGDIHLFARIVDNAEAAKLLPGAGWEPAEPLIGADGEEVGALWRSEKGSLFLPFDPGEVMLSYWSERYLLPSGNSRRPRAKDLAMHAYYRVRPALPRGVQISLRRAFSHIQARTSFPHWPVETSLHDFYALLFRLAAEVAGEPIPYIAPWPHGCTWALVLTHDVETQYGYDRIVLMLDIERSMGLRSSWNLVPKRYRIEDSLIEDLAAEGFEVGVHGLYHDGRDLESAGTLCERLPAIREHADRWGAVGFRSPATHRDWELMPLLRFDYDSSTPDTDPFEPQGGGCCSWLPYVNGDIVELPITLPQDHTLFVILRQGDEAWLRKADFLRDRGGMALLITHPDYMVETRRLDAYARFLKAYADDPSVWHALPRDVSAWWRRRAASEIERRGAGWHIAGPAADEATVAFAH